MNRKQIGEIGVAQAILHYTAQGWAVSMPLGDSSRYDLIVDKGNTLYRVQVKTVSTQKTPSGVPVVTLSTQGGNRSWNKEPKPISANECDLVFVHLVNGRSYEFPATYVAGKRSLNLGTKQDPFIL